MSLNLFSPCAGFVSSHAEALATGKVDRLLASRACATRASNLVCTIAYGPDCLLPLALVGSHGFDVGSSHSSLLALNLLDNRHRERLGAVVVSPLKDNPRDRK